MINVNLFVLATFLFIVHASSSSPHPPTKLTFARRFTGLGTMDRPKASCCRTDGPFEFPCSVSVDIGHRQKCFGLALFPTELSDLVSRKYPRLDDLENL